MGGFNDNSGTGAAWVFTRSGVDWHQQGSKLVGIGGLASAQQGTSVALSADGNTALVGGPVNGEQEPGAVCVSSPAAAASGPQQGSRFFGNAAVGGASEGASVALSADANTALVGGPGDDHQTGAAWVFVQPTVPFSAFICKLTISQPRFTFLSDFVLGGTSKGIDPVFESVTLQIGPFVTTIPPFSFKMTGPGNYSFTGVINGVALKVLIKHANASAYTFEAAADTNLTGIGKPGIGDAHRRQRYRHDRGPFLNSTEQRPVCVKRWGDLGLVSLPRRGVITQGSADASHVLLH